MDSDTDETQAASGFPINIFRYVEIAVYAVLGLLICVTALLSLGSAGAQLWIAMRDWDTTSAVFGVIDRLLFVFMLIEILHTIRASIQSHTLNCEPFLIVGLIATVRRVLVITLQSAEVAHDTTLTPEHEILFRTTMTELIVLGVLILIMVASIYLLRRSR
jgi:uncharacterized membrane protein (DUF373 family)